MALLSANKLPGKPALTAILFIIGSVLMCMTAQSANAAETDRIRVAVFPFNDIPSRSFDMNVPVVFRAELLRHDFIEMVPVEIITGEIHEIEPSFMWTEKEGLRNEGGIVWRIDRRVVEKIKTKVDAEFSIYGDLTRFGNKWRMDVYVMKEASEEPDMTFTGTGTREEEIFDEIARIAGETAEWLRKGNMLAEAEEGIRKYLGGIYTYTETVDRIEKIVKRADESIPLHALLLDLYLKKEIKYQDEIIREGMIIMNLYDPSNIRDIQYLMSLSLDPFDVTSEVYERWKNWTRAIEIRKKAIEKYPYRAEYHRRRLGEDYYHLALSLERRGQNNLALENFRKAVQYISPFSKYYLEVEKGYDRLKSICE